MSVRHQVRSRVEELFSKFKDIKGEFTVYNVYSPVYVQRENLPVDQIDVEEFNYVDIQVDTLDEESVKKFLERTTRETLENEVKGFYLFGMILDKGDDYVVSSDNQLFDSLKDEMVKVIERLKEE